MFAIYLTVAKHFFRVLGVFANYLLVAKHKLSDLLKTTQNQKSKRKIKKLKKILECTISSNFCTCSMKKTTCDNIFMLKLKKKFFFKYSKITFKPPQDGVL